MTRILALSGSLRVRSFNTALARAAREQAPDGVEIEVDTLHGIPLYDGDLEARSGIPEEVQALRRHIVWGDALLLVSPEYNNGIPGVFKNAVDWLSRTGDEVFTGRPVAVIGASPGGFGTILAQAHWLPVLRTLKTRVWTEGRLMVSKANTLIGEDGELKDAATLDQVGQFVAGFARFAAAGAAAD